MSALSEHHLAAILRIVSDHDAIVVGGQALNIWVRRYGIERSRFAGEEDFVSKDVDFYQNEAAAQALRKLLKDGRIRRPAVGDATPTELIVIGQLAGVPIQIDFMRSLIGVDEASIMKRRVALGDGQLLVNLLGPLDLLKSRLSNIDLLGRRGRNAVLQARASVFVMECYIDELLEVGRVKDATSSLRELEYITRRHSHQRSYLEHDIDPLPVMVHFLKDGRLDERWRHHRLAKAVSRIENLRSRLRPVAAPDFPSETHFVTCSRDGRSFTVRRKDGPSVVDNPMGPAVVSPTEERFYRKGILLHHSKRTKRDKD